MRMFQKHRPRTWIPSLRAKFCRTPIEVAIGSPPHTSPTDRQRLSSDSLRAEVPPPPPPTPPPPAYTTTPVRPPRPQIWKVKQYLAWRQQRKEDEENRKILELSAILVGTLPRCQCEGGSRVDIPNLAQPAGTEGVEPQSTTENDGVASADERTLCEEDDGAGRSGYGDVDGGGNIAEGHFGHPLERIDAHTGDSPCSPRSPCSKL